MIATNAKVWIVAQKVRFSVFIANIVMYVIALLLATLADDLFLNIFIALCIVVVLILLAVLFLLQTSLIHSDIWWNDHSPFEKFQSIVTHTTTVKNGMHHIPYIFN